MEEAPKPFAITYFSKSAHAPGGLGTGRGIERRPSVLSHAQSISVRKIDEQHHWRRMLSNFHPHTFEYCGVTYGSIEACFQAQKLQKYGDATAICPILKRLQDPSLPGNEAQQLGQKKSCKLSKADMQDWAGAPHRQAMASIQNCALAGDERKKALLIELHRLNVEIWHIPGQRKQPVRDPGLEALAARLARQEEEIRIFEEGAEEKVNQRVCSRSRSPRRMGSENKAS